MAEPSLELFHSSFAATLLFRPNFRDAKRMGKDQTLVWHMRRSIVGDKIKPRRSDFNILGSGGLKQSSFTEGVVSNSSGVLPQIPETSVTRKEEEESAENANNLEHFHA